VVELDLGVVPSPSGSGELLLVGEGDCRVVFVTAAAPASQVAVASFRGCVQVVFGYPNDESQPGHPLYEVADGWEYGFYEVHGSDWDARLQAQNRVVLPSQARWDVRHFMVACHENLVEVLAEDVTVEVSDRPFDEVAAEALRKNLQS
jgi:hypothetical protein